MAGSLNQFDLKGKVSLVTGGARGIGLGIARSLASLGSDVMIVSRTRSQLEQASAAILSAGGGGRASTFCADVGDLASHEAILQNTLDQFGKIDVLVNNAGSNIRKPFLDVTVEDYDAIMQIQLKSVYFLTQRVARQMVQAGGGKIINLASLTSKIGVANISIYGAAKGGVFALTKSLSLELAPHGITVNAVAPGYVRTAMTEAAFTDPKRQEWMLSRIPLRRFGQPEDIGGAVAYLASPAGDYLNGEVIFIDGGWLSS
jgi:NAD(P)-dependent dehydrogenase (short-subunit alcohol dehydrogenase family)